MFEYKKLLCFFIISSYLIASAQPKLLLGAEQTNLYLPLLKGKKIAMVVNQTSTIGSKHLIDTLRKLKVEISIIFAPEHGFRGNHGAGVHIKSGKDLQTGLKVISLYGEHKKPTMEDLKDIQLVLFDIQDVGARFYTYISTLHYIMEACAAYNKPLIVLDRPNPNGFYVDGPVLDTGFRSFVGMHPVPVIHGLTIGEYANMINGEKWLKDTLTCKLIVIPMKGYSHYLKYELPIKPSPNLPTVASVHLYPSLCLFEGTNYSVGRGTKKPFECVGKPNNTIGDYQFLPKPIMGEAENPPFKNETCKGFLLTDYSTELFLIEPKLNIDWLIAMYEADAQKQTFFTSFFDKLAGNDSLRKQIMSGIPEKQIRASWQPKLDAYKRMRMNYLLYEDFTVIYQIKTPNE